MTTEDKFSEGDAVANNSKTLTPLRIIIIYALLGGLWILLSDRILYALVKDPQTLTNLQTYKGWLYVVVTAVFLFYLVRQYADEQAEGERQRFTIFERISDAFVALDADWRYTYVNKKAGEFFNRKPEGLIGKHIWTEFPEGIDQPFYKAYYKSMEEQKFIQLEECYPPYDKWFENRIYPSKEGLTIYFHDITGRKKTEQALQEKERFLSESQRIAHIGSWGWDLKGPIKWTEETYHIYGVSPESFTPTIESLINLIHPEDRPSMQRWLEACWSGLYPDDLEFRVVLPDGTVRLLSGRGELIYDSEHRPAYMAGTVQDITERKQAEEELRTTNEELLSINRIITTTTTTIGVQDILETILNEALNITGLEGGTICLVGPDNTLNLTAHRATSEATILDLTTNEVKVGDCLCGECARDHKPLVLPDRDAVLKYSTREATRGEEIYFHAAFPLVIGKRCLGVLCVFTRTDFKPAERRLKLLETVTAQIAIAVENAQMFEEISHHTAILEDRVKERTKELQAANIKLQELDRLKSMFIASMSHELRTPLNSIIGFTGIILQGMSGDLNDTQRDQLHRVYSAARHLLSLITDVIDISKIEAGKIEAYPETFVLRELIDEAVASLKTEIDRKGLTVNTRIPQDLTLNTDRKRLLQCVLNYVSNAVKFTEKGIISIEAEESGDKVDIRVTDSGIGIKEEDVPRLFQSFVRLDSHLRTIAPGTGLGLYLTRKITTEVLGGTVSAESVYGKGSVFSIRIPKELKKT